MVPNRVSGSSPLEAAVVPAWRACFAVLHARNIRTFFSVRNNSVHTLLLSLPAPIDLLFASTGYFLPMIARAKSLARLPARLLLFVQL
eukprot:6178478-Pleurochrysis_carterae.AAC.3